MADLTDLKKSGVEGVIVGKAIYEGRIQLKDLEMFSNRS
jgi:phosphoribosylformimino-5-aminoimidazole carboxamide ribonucleotide (ProFAR) isomerase